MAGTQMKIRNYTELSKLETFEERFEYLKLGGNVGADTFGFDRYINQNFYQSLEWRSVRDFVILRDLGCDLGIDGRQIHAKPIIHHMNPITREDIENLTRYLLDPEYLITTVLQTHNAIHYGDASKLLKDPIIRRAGDTCPWR